MPYTPAKIWRANTFVMKSSPYADMLQQQLADFCMHNSGSVKHSATIWIAHRVFVRRIIAKRRRTQLIDEILTENYSIEAMNKSSTAAAIGLI